MTDKKWTRRKFSKAAATAQLMLGSGLLDFTTSCGDPTSKDGNVLDPAQQNLLKSAMDEIIPAVDPMPAASEIGAVEYVVEVLKDYPDLKAPLQQILGEIEVLSREKFHKGFDSISKQQRIETLQAYETAKPDPFTILKHLTFESYYTNERIWQLIGYEPYPTLSSGPKMDPFDESLLSRVKGLTKLYIDPETHG